MKACRACPRPRIRSNPEQGCGSSSAAHSRASRWPRGRKRRLSTDAAEAPPAPRQRRRKRRRTRNCHRSSSSAPRRSSASARRSKKCPRTCRPSRAREIEAQHSPTIARLPGEERRQRRYQRRAGQSVADRHQLSRLHRLAAARHAAGFVGVHGRRAHQRALRRCRQLGSDSAGRDPDDADHPRLESDFRPEHARRRGRGDDQERPQQSGRQCRRRLRLVGDASPRKSSKAA